MRSVCRRVDRSDLGGGAVDRREVVGRDPALRLQRGRAERVDVAERQRGRPARRDRGGKRFLRGDPALALRALRRIAASRSALAAAGSNAASPVRA